MAYEDDIEYRDPNVIVDKQALLNVVRKIDIDAPISNEAFAASFDRLREVFTQEEFSSGFIGTKPGA